MPKPESIKQLDNRKVLRILGYLTEELQATMPPDQVTAVQSEDEARQVLAALLVTAGESEHLDQAASLIPDDEALAAQGRRVLDFMLQDPATRPIAEQLVAAPPDETQMSVELAIAGAAILGTLIAWLQTRVSLSLERKDGKTNIKLVISKGATDSSIIKEVARSVRALLTV
jgi:hypothetical protein